ncbi:MAG: RNA polymerase subunit sigma-24, partial [Acidimicrobiia bacterium]|nr:RNA polymerase subunit sigma-24 [Acidimicrobiia bacterium]NNL28417.1 RNA polymerase subunit sigma-24 [Acidimicrobiia bacterium]
DENGTPVLMADQNRDLWDHDAIAEADELLNRALRLGSPDPYQLQAAIACVHGLAPTAEETDWQEIVLLYDRLFEMQPSPVVAVNRAIALAEFEGDEAGWHALELVDGMDHWHFFHAARAELLRRMGDSAGARSAYEQALACKLGPTDARFLEDRLSSLRP